MRIKGMVSAAAAALSGFAVLASSPTALASDVSSPEPPESRSVSADLNGDHVPELVTVRENGDYQHVIGAQFSNNAYIEMPYQADEQARQLPEPRVVDVNRDGDAEIIVTTSVGANTLTLKIVNYDPHTRSLVLMDDGAGQPFTFFDGGGAVMVSRYGCMSPDHDGETFQTLSAENHEGRYDGIRTWYLASGNSVLSRGNSKFQGVPYDHPEMNVRPESCRL